MYLQHSAVILTAEQVEQVQEPGVDEMEVEQQPPTGEVAPKPPQQQAEAEAQPSAEGVAGDEEEVLHCRNDNAPAHPVEGKDLAVGLYKCFNIEI